MKWDPTLGDERNQVQKINALSAETYNAMHNFGCEPKKLAGLAILQDKNTIEQCTAAG